MSEALRLPDRSSHRSRVAAGVRAQIALAGPQRRTEYARYRNGHWSARNPYTGLYEPMEVAS